MQELIADSELSVRAINPDNKSELMQLISLVSRALETHSDSSTAHTQADEATRASVQNPRFVRACLGSKFISLVACLDGKPIAHLAYTSSQTDRIQILLPLIDPDYKELFPAVENLFRTVIIAEARKKSWREIEIQQLASPCALTLKNIPSQLFSSEVQFRTATSRTRTLRAQSQSELD